MKALPETATVKICLHANTRWGDGTEILPFVSDMTEYGYTYLGDVTVTVPVPQVDVRQRMLDALRDEKQKLLAEAQVKANQIDEKIQSLLALEHKAEVKSCQRA